MVDFFNMSSKDIIFLSAAVSAVIADGLTADELNTLGAFITCIGDELTAAAAQKTLREAKVQDFLRESEEV